MLEKICREGGKPGSIGFPFRLTAFPAISSLHITGRIEPGALCSQHKKL